jgi:predicted GIY-YIG superfamily endonuclease
MNMFRIKKKLKKDCNMGLSRQDVEQIVQQTVQSAIEQVLQTSGQFQADKKMLGFTSNTEDTQTDEAIRGKSYTDSEMWGVNKKLVVASEMTERSRSIDHDKALKALEIKEKELAIAEREAKLRKQAAFDAIEVSEREQASLLKHMSNHLHLDFRATVQESQLPVIDDDQTVKNESK